MTWVSDQKRLLGEAVFDHCAPLLRRSVKRQAAGALAAWGKDCVSGCGRQLLETEARASGPDTCPGKGAVAQGACLSLIPISYKTKSLPHSRGENRLYGPNPYPRPSSYLHAGASPDVPRVMAAEAARNAAGLMGSRMSGKMRSCSVRGLETPGQAWRALMKALARPGSPGLPVRRFVLCQTHSGRQQVPLPGRARMPRSWTAEEFLSLLAGGAELLGSVLVLQSRESPGDVELMSSLQILSVPEKLRLWNIRKNCVAVV